MKQVILIVIICSILSLTSCLDSAHCLSVDELEKYGFSASEAKEIQEKISNACPNGSSPQGSLTKRVYSKKTEHEEVWTDETVDTIGKCFEITYAKFIYLVDKKHAIYQARIDYFAKPLLLLEFVESLANSEIFNGVIKGVGLFEYKDGRGIPRIIPHVVVVQEYRKRMQ